MRYYCHHCHTQIPADELLPEFTCPSCHSGFVEEMPSNVPANHPRNNSNADESHRGGSDDGLAGLLPARRSSDEFSDDNSDVEFLDAVNGPLAQVFGLFQPQQQSQHLQRSTTPVPSSDSGVGQSSSSQSDGSPTATNDINSNQNRSVARSAARLNAAQIHPHISTNQSLTDVLNEFITGVSFGTQFPEGMASNSQNRGTSGGNQIPANRGLINIDFPLPLFLHSNPGDYAWGNAGFDAVITQLLNNLDGSNSGPPPMPKDQVENLATVKISDEQVKNTNLQCTVCMDDFQVGDSARQLPCEHFFHQDCILPWLNLHASCPICRKTFVTGANATQNLNASAPQSETNDTNTSVNASTNSSITTSGVTTQPTNRSAASSTATVTNQNITPRYDYTEDDCD